MSTSAEGNLFGATPWWKQALVWSLATGTITLAVGFTLGKAFAPKAESVPEAVAPAPGMPTPVFTQMSDGQGILPTRPGSTSRVQLVDEPEPAHALAPVE